MVDIELDEPVKEMLEELESNHGEEQIQKDMKQILQQAIWESYSDN